VTEGRATVEGVQGLPDPGRGSVADPIASPPLALLRRREVAAHARRRRLLFADIGLGLGIGAFALVLGLGLAPVALVALIVLGVCVASFAHGRLRRRRLHRR
jgi:drug/metabolite transporter (DMT)-like permease